jgi:hypothetical protein
MSQGPSRAFPTQNYTAIPNVPIQPRQQQQLQMQHSALSNQQQSYPQFINGTNSSAPNNSTNSNTNGTYSPNNNRSTTAANGVTDNLYCDSCQTFRHVSFFHERDFKYKVCNVCQTRDIQKKKHQIEKYELYEEQQKNYKHPTRYQQQLHSSSSPINLSSNSNSNSNSSPPLPPPQSMSSPPQIIKQSPPTTHIINTSHLYNNSPSPSSIAPIIITATKRNQSRMQRQSIQASAISLPLPAPQQQQDSLSQSPNNNLTHIITPTRTAITSTSTATTSSSPAPAPGANTILTPPVTHHKSSTAAERAALDMIDLDTFVRELEKETHFDRRQYHLDIGPLIESIGDNPSFTQLGRGICGRVLEGTKFNFR